MANKKTKRTKAAVIQALQTYKGLLSLAARALGVTPQTLWNYRKRWPELEQVIADAEEEMLDTAELALYGKIAAGDLKAIMFYLKTKGNKRGYTVANGRLQAATSQMVDSLVKVACNAQRTSTDVVHGTPQDGDAPSLGTGGVVKLLEALLQQVDRSALHIAEKSRLTVAIADALLRAINADEIVKRQEALQAVLQNRKDGKR